MSFPKELDRDRVLAETLQGLQEALKGWHKGGLITEEPLMNHMIGKFNRGRRQCDVGVHEPITAISKVALLHRRGANNTADAYGADLAITIEISERKFRKTVIFQIKISENFHLRVERKQLDQALADTRTANRSFLLVVDKIRSLLRVISVQEVLQLINDGNESAGIDCAEWMTISEWITNWLSCSIGEESRIDDPSSVEKLLQDFVVAPPDDWESPWNSGNASNYRDDAVPVKAWLEIFFRRVAGSKETKQ